MPSYYPVVALMLTEGAVPADCFSLPRDSDRAFDLLRTSEGRRELSFNLRKPLGEVRWRLFEIQVSAIERDGMGVLTCLDDKYPACLRDIPQSPAVLFYRGEPSRLDGRGVAVVGGRRASARGVAFTRSLAGETAAVGLAVVSGAARGIDTAAHQGALEHGGVTIAVLGTGLDVPYPPGNVGLLDRIARSGGCVVSEQLFGTPPLKYVFPQRNRLISGLSRTVVVVEAGERSGALITARWALEQGRDVGAVPGFPGDPRCRGSNRLIKAGAYPVEGVGDILEAVPLLGSAARPVPEEPVETKRRGSKGAPPSEQAGHTACVKAGAALLGLTREARAVLGALGPSPVDVDTLAHHLRLPASSVQGLLLELELRGLVERDVSGAYHAL